MTIFSDRLKWLREENRLTQKFAAEHIGVTPGALQKFETGERVPKITTLKKICRLYKVKSDFLLGLTNLYGEVEDNYYMFFDLRLKEKLSVKELTNLALEEQKVNEMIGESPINENASKIIINLIKNRENKIKREIYTIKNKIDSTLEDYIDGIYGIPFANVSTDEIIRLLAPFKFEIEKENKLYILKLNSSDGESYSIGRFNNQDDLLDYVDDLKEFLGDNLEE